MLSENVFDTGEVSINFVEGPPSGSPLILLHGISGWWRSYLPVIPNLAFRWHIYGLDHRGHGRSEHVPNGYRLEGYVSDAVAFIEQEVGEPVYLLGHSLGGLTSIGIAAAIPHMVKAIVLEDPPVYGYKGDRLKTRPFYELFIGWRDLASMNGTVDEIADRLAALQPDNNAADRRFKARALQQLDPDVLGMYVDGSATDTYNMDTLLPKITCPALFIRGEPELGGAIEDQDVARVLSLLPHATFVPVADAGHLIHSVKPVEYCQVVSKFLESCE